MLAYPQGYWVVSNKKSTLRWAFLVLLSPELNLEARLQTKGNDSKF